MATATDTKYIPIISSSTVGPLGVMHLPRLWTKLTLGNAGLLPEGHDYCGKGFDQMTISDLGLDRDKVIEFVKTTKPTYVEFEAWVKANGKTDAETIKKHNDAVKGYIHGDELCCLAPLTRANFTRAAYRVIGPEPAALEVS